MLYSYNPKLNTIYAYSKLGENNSDKKKEFEECILSYCNKHNLYYNPRHLIMDTLQKDDNKRTRPNLVNLLTHLKAGDLLIIQGISSITTDTKEILEFYNVLEKRGILLVVLNNIDYLSTYPPAKTLEEQRTRMKYRELVIIGYELGLETAKYKFEMQVNERNNFSKAPGAPRIQVDEDVFKRVYDYWDSHPDYSYAEACKQLEEEGHPYRYNSKTQQKDYTKFNPDTLADEPLKISKQTFQNMINRYRAEHHIEGNRRDVTGKYTLLAKASHR